MEAEYNSKAQSLIKTHENEIRLLREKLEHDAKIALKQREIECNTSADSVKNDMVSKVKLSLCSLSVLIISPMVIFGCCRWRSY